MSLNNVRLNPRLLAQLYPLSLLENEVPAVTANPGVKENSEATKTAPHKVEPAPGSGEVTAATPAMPAVAVAAQPVAYGNTPSLGGNKKGVLILVSQAEVPFLPDADLEFLSAILGACRLSIADVAIVNLHHYPQPYTALVQQFASRQVLLMGVAPQQIDLPFDFPHFQLQPFDGRTFLLAYPLGQMKDDRNLKMQLWSCLKRLFGV